MAAPKNLSLNSHAMATVKEIKQELSDTKKEYDEVKEKLEKFEEGEKARRLDALRRGRAQEEFDNEKEELEGKRKELKEEKKSWKDTIQKLQDALAATATPAGNNLVTLVKS